MKVRDRLLFWACFAFYAVAVLPVSIVVAQWELRGR